MSDVAKVVFDLILINLSKLRLKSICAMNNLHTVSHTALTLYYNTPIECAVSFNIPQPHTDGRSNHFHAYAIYTDSLKHKPFTDFPCLAARQTWVQSMYRGHCGITL